MKSSDDEMDPTATGHGGGEHFGNVPPHKMPCGKTKEPHPLGHTRKRIFSPICSFYVRLSTCKEIFMYCRTFKPSTLYVL